jgi:hypothetical protein
MESTKINTNNWKELKGKAANKRALYEVRVQKIIEENEEFQNIFGSKKDDIERKWHERMVMNLLETRPIPNHVAFIMDGNRRFAREKKMDNVLEGHKEGSKKLAKVSFYH